MRVDAGLLKYIWSGVTCRSLLGAIVQGLDICCAVLYGYRGFYGLWQRGPLCCLLVDYSVFLFSVCMIVIK